jgi:hypothetical protein
MDATKELIKQLILFASILAGFSFAGVLQLITLNSPKKIISWTMGSLIIASLMMLSSTFIACLLLYKLELFKTAQEIPSNLLLLFGQIGVFELILLIVGMFLFALGVGLSGWIRSRPVGIVSSVFAALTFGFMLWCIAVIFPA